MVKMQKLARVVGLLSLLVAVFAAGVLTGASNRTIFAQGNDVQPANAQKLFAPFWESWNMVHQRYVDPIDDTKLMEGAISGMMNALGDRHSGYMTPRLYESLTSDLTGTFEGIGATIRKDEKTGGILIVSTIEDSPARKSGLRSGDIIMTVNGKDVTPLNETDVVSQVRGPAGTSVLLGILRKGDKKLTDFTLTRAKINLPIVSTQVYTGQIGYVRLTEFSDTATSELTKVLKGMDANNLKGLVLDLRDNPGGGLQTAVDIASIFLKKGQPVVTERFKTGSKDLTLYSNNRTLAPDVPLVILVNAGSASASELVGAALQDHKRAVLVGTRTFGKGSVQTWSRLQNGGGVRITIAHFYGPADKLIHERGLTPDYYVGWDVEASPDYDPQLAQALWILKGEF